MKQICVFRGGKYVPCGRILEESAMLVWERQVTECRHLFRCGRAWDGTVVRDAWTIGEALLGQLRELGVQRIRYVTRSSIYEVGVEEFMRQARELDQTRWGTTTEAQWALPRSQWRVQTRRVNLSSSRRLHKRRG